MYALLLCTVEAEGERAHESNELLRLEVRLGKALHHEAASVGLSSVLNGITLTTDVFTTHVEDHCGTTAVLDGSVASELDEVSIAKPRRDVVTSLSDFFNLLHGEVQLLALRNGELVL